MADEGFLTGSLVLRADLTPLTTPSTGQRTRHLKRSFMRERVAEQYTWEELNTILRNAANEDVVKKILNDAVDASLHPTYVFRIYGRYTRLRREREIREIAKGKKLTA